MDVQYEQELEELQLFFFFFLVEYRDVKLRRMADDDWPLAAGT